MKSAELLVTNVILDPTYKPVKLSLVGAMVRPVIAGRALPPRATRILSMNELNAGVVADLIRGIEHGAPVVEETPEPVATPEDLLAPEPVAEEKAAYTADALMALKSDQLSELLVAEFAYPADQLYKLKTKQAKIDEILARQGE
jgi:hypothetical protein